MFVGVFRAVLYVELKAEVLHMRWVEKFAGVLRAVLYVELKAEVLHMWAFVVLHLAPRGVELKACECPPVSYHARPLVIWMFLASE